ncbi:hypothetical protein [Lacrimispora sphenoides]|uniref:hypothetical protein n=1 Tax=Lacrimispora sphenoides TaxID=29370 RepID=UPI00140D98A8|nr:hypothetical protein [Lacrimispora sphenoides]
MSLLIGAMVFHIRLNAQTVWLLTVQQSQSQFPPRVSVLIILLLPLRRIAPYFNRVNTEYENKSRPPSDNGKFYIYVPGGEILSRNAAYFSLRPAKDYENGRGAGIYVTKFIDPPLGQMCLCVRIEVQLPHGKLKRMRKMLAGNLPDETERFIREFDSEGLRSALTLEAKQNAIRNFFARGKLLCVYR